MLGPTHGGLFELVYIYVDVRVVSLEMNVYFAFFNQKRVNLGSQRRNVFVLQSVTLERVKYTGETFRFLWNLCHGHVLHQRDVPAHSTSSA
jgi:hypothetical protein